MDSDNKNYEIDYIIIKDNKKSILESDDAKGKAKISMDIILKEVK